MSSEQQKTQFGEYSDEELAALAKQSTEAAGELTKRFFAPIRAAAVAIDQQISDDLLQEGLLAMLSAVGSFDEKRGSLRAYVMTCARNRMLSAVRRNKPLGGDYDGSEELEDKTEPAADDGAMELFRELYEAMERQLTERERGVLTAYMTGMSYAEIAQSLEITEKAVDNAMQRARRKLRKEFGRQP
ncbi:rNA polymerase sigma factor sigma-70 family [Ruminococcus sp. CAG:579]|uniref:RNA polymerase sigma factor n=1 Tax=Ruminococcus sp. 210702-SL.1.03 TaxID=2883233 RepID=UPI0003358E35|nr:sigma-70 family RNA polymerase sigma factor [Ruminococcus sp. 210702-SL.1.03]MCB6615287.1 sigma-70 family RNA polymerase sigma factor [Ruminococcus sp. 210702-SL.1.03]CDA72249.1 rNA polymerase sigma factor sigma-70 family [Ruminococcus sp. CAG:579]